MARMHMSALLMVALLAAPVQPLTWKVTGADVTFEMSAKDLRALRDGKEVFGLQSRQADFLSNFKAEEGTNTFGWEGSQSLKVLSVVGPWVSYENSDSGFTGGAHPYASTSYVTEDVTKPKGAFSLLSVFPEKDVVAALKADRFIRKHIHDEAAFKDARTVDALMQSLEPGEDCVGFDSGGLESVKRSVAFHHIEGNKVAVRISFGYAAEACRGRSFVVGVLLTISAELRPALKRAARREEGFLMKDAKAVKAPSVHFTWESPEPKQE
ncbi:hypothetical protein [Myxococcus xanthus]|uniref:hypothetical protein n=1 Tax=Myxococcus xanthus TaxID=34 RepID=UPI0021E51B53|nr:hypothetical protein [Myxococcus xanthus]UYI12614.1 hypothetical protein N3T43_26575 [Myxococcus xanthus]